MRIAVTVLAASMLLGCKKDASAPRGAPEARVAAPTHVEIALPEDAPRLDAVESGTYVLATSLQFEGGREHGERQTCEVSVKGDAIEIALQRAGVEPIRGTIRAGLLKARGREGDGSYELEGQVTGTGRLAGVIKGSVPGQVTIRDGRWELERAQ